VYYPPFWEGKSVLDAERVYLQTTLECVQAHEDFDVLGHLTYLSKAQHHPTHAPIILGNHREVVAEIMKMLIAKGKGMEINTSGVDRCGGYLPTADYLRLFKDLGGKIVTVGSDAHTADRVGQYCFDACALVKEIFGYVCTFEKREPIFHK
jgi:histidinol-phosphatase (PHP family)